MASLSSKVDPTSFAVTSVAAVLEWRPSGDQHSQYIGCRGATGSCRIALDAGLDVAENKFKLDLRIPVEVNGLSKTTHFHILVQPEYITSFVSKRSLMSTAPDRVRTTFVQRKEAASSRGLITITCQTERAATLIGPSKQCDITPRTKKTRELFDQIQSFQQHAKKFSIYVPGEALSDEQLQSICELATRTISEMLPLKRMYGGKGGQILQNDDLDTAPPFDPPSYDEIGPTPSPPGKRQKRKGNLMGLSSAPILSNKLAKLTDESPELKLLKDDMAALRSEIQELRSQKADLLSTSDAQIPNTCYRSTTEHPHATEKAETSTKPKLEAFTQRLDALDDRVSEVDQRYSAAVSQLEASFAERMKDAEERFERRLKQTEERLNDRFEENEQWFEKRSEAVLEQAKADADDVVWSADIRWDEQLAGEKQDLRDFVREEMKNVEDDIKDDLKHGRATICVEWD